jgi:CheY-like chemotaxis protein
MAYLLLVDDDCDGSEAVATFLRRSGHQVDCVPNGHRAMAALTTNKPDAVILDVRMPKMDGIMLLEVMRSYLRWFEMPVVLLSAHITDEQADRAREMGVRHILHKTKTSLEELGAAVDDVTKARDQGAGLPA